MDNLESPLLSIDQASRILPVSKSLIYNLVKAGTLPSVRIGTKLFFKREVIERVMREGTNPIPKQHPVLHKEQR